MSKLIYMTIIGDPNISPEQRKKEIEYKEYLDNHISNVIQAWENMKHKPKCIQVIQDSPLLKSNIEYLKSTVDNLVRNHDASKYSAEEWEPYRRHWHPVNEQEKIDSKADMDRAWEHHYTTNMHHWDWWHIIHKEKDMLICYVVEMCCDWIAMSMVKGGDALSWFNNNKEIVLGPEQKKLVIELLTAYYESK